MNRIRLSMDKGTFVKGKGFHKAVSTDGMKAGSKMQGAFTFPVKNVAYGGEQIQREGGSPNRDKSWM